MKLFQVWRQKEEWEEEKFKSQLPTLLPQHRGENLNLNFKSNLVQYKGYTLLKNLNLQGSLGFLPAQIFDPYKALLPHLNQVDVTRIIWSSLIVDPEHR